jgi:hypothetical protein
VPSSSPSVLLIVILPPIPIVIPIVPRVSPPRRVVSIAFLRGRTLRRRRVPGFLGVGRVSAGAVGLLLVLDVPVKLLGGSEGNGGVRSRRHEWCRWKEWKRREGKEERGKRRRSSLFVRLSPRRQSYPHLKVG